MWEAGRAKRAFFNVLVAGSSRFVRTGLCLRGGGGRPTIRGRTEETEGMTAGPTMREMMTGGGRRLLGLRLVCSDDGGEL